MNKLVDELLANQRITSEKVAETMRTVDRGIFCSATSGVYSDSPSPIGFNATISAPHMHAFALQALEPVLKAGASILDIGSGSGYLVAAFSQMMEHQGKVIGVEHVSKLNEQAKRNIQLFNSRLVSEGIVQLETFDGRRGFSPKAPYDGIHIGASVQTIEPELVAQLKTGGRIVAPLGVEMHIQVMKVLEKQHDGTLRECGPCPYVQYVPLTELSRQLP
jgi:protein-L-isoaspartate(D-aspartate) O-methyltransferase